MADNNNNNAIITIGPFPFFPDFRFQFPNPLHRKPQPSHRIVASDDRTVSSSSDGKPDALKFTERKPSPAPPLRLEVDEPSNPLITYSVYAMGGFIIVKWVWARWNERKERAKKGSSSSSSEAEETQNPENESPGEGED